MRPLAELELDEERGVVLARLRGEIDLSNAEPMRLQMDEAVPNQAIGLIVDLTGVRYLDSSGIRMLFDIARRLERRQQRLSTVIESGSPVHELLAMVGALDRLGVEDSLEKAEMSIFVDSVLDEQG
jgi:anti-anti-sigma factor